MGEVCLAVAGEETFGRDGDSYFAYGAASIGGSVPHSSSPSIVCAAVFGTASPRESIDPRGLASATSTVRVGNRDILQPPRDLGRYQGIAEATVGIF
jgi:hypothetical protein